MELEKIALTDEYFIEKKLYPNIDFYSGITLKAMGFPVTMFTVLFALARTVGWIAQWEEMTTDKTQRDRPPASGLHRRAATRLHTGRPALIAADYRNTKGGSVGAALFRLHGVLDALPSVAAQESLAGSSRRR